MPATDRKIVLAGCGYTPLSRAVVETEITLAETACRNAIEDAGIALPEIDGINIQVHHYPPPDTDGIVRRLGLKSVRWREDGGLGVPALIQAAQVIESGVCDCIVVCKIMNTTATVLTPPIDPITFRVGGREQFEVPYGVGYTMQHVALAARRWMLETGVTPEQVGWLCVTQRQHAALNPRAILRGKPLTIDEYLTSRWIADPIRVLDCDYPVNGAYAYVIAAGDKAHRFRHDLVEVVGWAEASGARNPTFDPAVLTQSTDWVSEIYSAARITPNDIDVWLLYDGFSHTAMQWIEAIGLTERGGSGELVQGGTNIRFDGERPVNTHGGQLSEGRLHGTGQILEAVQQLRGSAVGRQVPEALHAVVATGFPGAGAAAILRRCD
jgi:acetyl-CoA acetyltransferase